MSNIQIDRRFGSRIIDLTWEDIKFGLERNWLDIGLIVDFALKQLETTDDPIITELAFLDFDEKMAIRDKFELLKISSNSKINEPRWLKITTAWLYEHRDNFDDPILELSSHFNDFEDAEEIRDFTFYGRLEGEPRNLIADWKSYLDNQVYGTIICKSYELI